MGGLMQLPGLDDSEELMSSARQQRRKTKRKAGDGRIIRIQLRDSMGNPRWVTSDLIDTSEGGVSVSSMTLLQPGSILALRGNFGDARSNVEMRGRVKWSVEAANGAFRSGIEFLDHHADSADSRQQQTANIDPQDFDCYEIMQLSPNADGETIGRVFRMLAQRYHPDNPQTGNSDLFVRLSEANQILSDPEKRAGYDAHHRQTKQLHWKIFDQSRVSTGQEAEQRKRKGILSLLYAKMTHDPEKGAMTILEFEDLLGCPREHLQAALWYLRGKGLIQRGDNGRHSITVQGFDWVEKYGAQPESMDPRLLDPAP